MKKQWHQEATEHMKTQDWDIQQWKARLRVVRLEQRGGEVLLKNNRTRNASPLFLLSFKMAVLPTPLHSTFDSTGSTLLKKNESPRVNENLPSDSKYSERDTNDSKDK